MSHSTRIGSLATLNHNGFPIVGNDYDLSHIFAKVIDAEQRATNVIMPNHSGNHKKRNKSSLLSATTFRQHNDFSLRFATSVLEGHISIEEFEISSQITFSIL